MLLALDSLKFYKLKSENIARIFFVSVYLLYFGFLMFPIGKAFDMDRLIEVMKSGDISQFPQWTAANLVYYLSQIVFTILMSYFSLMYATCYVMEYDGFPGKKGVIASLRRLPSLIGFALLLVVPILVSSLFLFIPMIYVYYSLFFAPVLITESKKGIFEAIIESFRVSRGFKLNIFFTQMLIYFILNIPVSLFAAGFLYSGYDGTAAEYLVMSFLYAARILIAGRMIGNFYILAVKNEGQIKKIMDDITRENSGSQDDQDSQDDEEDQNDRENRE